MKTPTRTDSGFAALAAALALLAILVTPLVALGHAELATVAPKDKSTTVGSPSEIVMTFTETLDPAKSSIKLLDFGGSVILEGSTVDADGKTMRLAIATPLEPAAYSVRWVSSSRQDGDIDRGVTTFTVTAGSAAPSTRPEPSVVASASPAPSVAASVAPSLEPSPSLPPGSPAASQSDALIPIVAVAVAIVALGFWLLRGRRRSA